MTALVAPRAALQPADVIDHPSGYLALSPRNRRFQLPKQTGFIAYREHGLHWVALGGVHAPRENRRPLLESFVARASRQRRRVLAVQVREDQVELFAALGFTVNPLGRTYVIDLDGYTLAGTRRMKARQKAQQAHRAGLRALELGVELPRTEPTFERLRAVSAAWLRGKRKPELDFMVGELGGPNCGERRIFAVVDRTDNPLGFITYVPVWGERPGYLHDLTRRLPNAPVGVMELCNATAIARFQQEHVAFLHLGFTPFAVEGVAAPHASPLLMRLARLLWRYGGKIYPAQSQVAYKQKWGPTFAEAEYVAGRPLSLRAVWDLLRLTRSI
jgi:lysylphosphatidylglycerol synthetase-like protein (DUF2156 family)